MAVIVIVGIPIGNITFTCSMTGTFVKEAVITVVSDNGDSLSPIYAPDIMAPATNGNGISKLAPTPIIAIPLVPTEPKEVPVVKDVIASTIIATTKKTL